MSHDLVTVREVFDTWTRPSDVRRPKFPMMRDVKRAVSEYYLVSQADLCSVHRSVPIVRARQIAMYLCRELTNRSFPQIGTAFDRDHTTVLHAHHKIARLIQTNPQLAEEIAALRKLIEAS